MTNMECEHYSASEMLQLPCISVQYIRKEEKNVSDINLNVPTLFQSELPRPIPRNSVESDHG